MLAVSALAQFRPLVVTPTHSHSVFVNYFVSTLNLVVEAQNYGMPVTVRTPFGESLITRAQCFGRPVPA